MMSSGMPELQQEDDIIYLKNQLMLELNDDEARDHFEKEIKKSLGDTFRRIDNLIHNVRHN